MANYKRNEARDWARERLVGAINCTIPTFTGDLTAINEKAIRHDVRRAIEHGFIGSLAGARRIHCDVDAERLEFLVH